MVSGINWYAGGIIETYINDKPVSNVDTIHELSIFLIEKVGKIIDCVRKYFQSSEIKHWQGIHDSLQSRAQAQVNYFIANNKFKKAKESYSENDDNYQSAFDKCKKCVKEMRSKPSIHVHDYIQLKHLYEDELQSKCKDLQTIYKNTILLKDIINTMSSITENQIKLSGIKTDQERDGITEEQEAELKAEFDKLNVNNNNLKDELNNLLEKAGKQGLIKIDAADKDFVMPSLKCHECWAD
jgi:hypothetical protein